MTLEALHERLDGLQWLRGQYIVLPNVTDGGHYTLMRSKFQAHYRKMPCVGGYLDKPVAKTGAGNRGIFAGKNPAYGNKRIAVVQTSDARHFDKLGANASWIKWAEPTAEALRQACLAEESRIVHEAPGLPSVHITRLEVSNSKFLGPVALELNPQYNAFIGGRGTGKSSALEYLRWALCDQPPGPADDGDGSVDLAARRRRLIEGTLAPHHADVEAHFSVNGIAHYVRRDATTNQLELKIGDGKLAPAGEGEVRALLPIQAYSQRQLSDVGVQLDELTRFVTAPIRDQLDDIDTKTADLADAIRENFAALQRSRNLRRQHSRDLLALKSLDQQAKKLRAGIGGLSSEDQQTITAKSGYDAGEALVQNAARRTAQGLDELDAVAATLKQLSGGLTKPTKGMPEQDTLAQIDARAREMLADAEQAVRAARQALADATNPGTDYGAAAAAWQKSRSGFQKAYEKAVAKSDAHRDRLDELAALETRQRALQDVIDKQAQEIELAGDPSARHDELRSAWRALRQQRTDRLQAQCVGLTELSEGLIQATISRGAGTGAQQERFKAELQGTNVRSNKVEKFLAAVAAADDPLAAWHAALDELEQRILTVDAGGQTSGTPTTALGSFTGPELDKIARKLTPESALELSLMSLGDHPVFRYCAKEGKDIAFHDASAGQQATALLRVLLNQAGPPLLIDQPEDDLDSQVIQEVVELIWQAKVKRQLIFSSHNANLVVNGDAELVACFNYRTVGDHSSGHIDLEGAIDVPKVRDRITTVMEGGEKAFKLRKAKYGF